ncbi:hypothetical protein BLNAU_15122 [Blattamonas nauphoetae]|uniref:Uncharacterized protein n=1 Tax=Blattamonas nauphoetae TaxID=2049346 RepID=A0ABQ9XEY9_9EUKA|nr:hypothetical protein BLNAU_15122 [Blattamonas nauphoetae]
MPHDPHEIIQSRLAEISTEDLYNLLLLMVPLDLSKQPTRNHAVYILQVKRVFDVSLTPQSQQPLYLAVILHVWNWIDDTALFRIESEGLTSVSGSKLILEGLTTEQKSLAIFLTEPNLAERMEEIVEVLIEEMRLVGNLSQTIKEMNESVISEPLTMTVLKKEIVTSAIFLSRVALFVAEGSRQFRKCKSVEPVAVVVAPNRNSDTFFTGFQHTPSRDMPNLFLIYGITNPQLSAANAVFSEEHDRDA